MTVLWRSTWIEALYHSLMCDDVLWLASTTAAIAASVMDRTDGHHDDSHGCEDATSTWRKLKPSKRRYPFPVKTVTALDLGLLFHGKHKLMIRLLPRGSREETNKLKVICPVGENIELLVCVCCVSARPRGAALSEM